MGFDTLLELLIDQSPRHSARGYQVTDGAESAAEDLRAGREVRPFTTIRDLVPLGGTRSRMALKARPKICAPVARCDHS
jgi:hypothetical protein